MDVQAILTTLQELFTVFGLQILAAIAIFAVGKWLAGRLSKLTVNILNRNNVDPTLVKFLRNIVYTLLLVFTVLAALRQVGIETTSFIAVLGAAGLAIGLALQGSLSNFAAGVLMIIFRPVKVGDLIEAAGATGFVEEVQIFTTKLVTPDNKTVIIPNSNMTADNIINYSTKGKIRIDLVFGIGYEDDMSKAKKILSDVMQNHDKVLKDPPPFVGLESLGDSSVNFAARPWVDPKHYWDVYFDVQEEVKRRFDVEGVSIPFPQRDVHVYQHSSGE